MRILVLTMLVVFLGNTGICQTGNRRGEINSGCGIDTKNDNLSDIMACMWTESLGKPAYIVIAMEARTKDHRKVVFVSNIVASSTYNEDIKYRLADRMEEKIEKLYPTQYTVVYRCCDDYASYSCASSLIRRKYSKAIKISLGNMP